MNYSYQVGRGGGGEGGGGVSGFEPNIFLT